MPERDDVSSQLPCHLVDCAPPEPAADVASVVRLFGQQTKRRCIFDIRPIHAPAAQERSDRMNRSQKLPLLNREGADGKIDGCALLQQQQRFEKRQRIFAARNPDSYPIALPDHPESANRVAGLPQNSFFQIHYSHDIGLVRDNATLR